MANYYRSGSKPIRDTCWQAFKVGKNGFVNVGRPFKVRGKEVAEEMDKARGIKGHEPSNIARRKARRKFRTMAGVEQVPCGRRG